MKFFSDNLYGNSQTRKNSAKADEELEVLESKRFHYIKISKASKYF